MYICKCVYASAQVDHCSNDLSQKRPPGLNDQFSSVALKKELSCNGGNTVCVCVCVCVHYTNTLILSKNNIMVLMTIIIIITAASYILPYSN